MVRELRGKGWIEGRAVDMKGKERLMGFLRGEWGAYREWNTLPLHSPLKKKGKKRKKKKNKKAFRSKTKQELGRPLPHLKNAISNPAIETKTEKRGIKIASPILIHRSEPWYDWNFWLRWLRCPYSGCQLGGKGIGWVSTTKDTLIPLGKTGS